MNLLTDQRERQEKNSFLDESIIPSPALHLVDDEKIDLPKADMSLPLPDSGGFERGSPKAKRFVVSFLLIFAFLGIIGGAVYYGYFYKRPPKVTVVPDTPFEGTKADTVAAQQTPAVQAESPKATEDADSTSPVAAAETLPETRPATGSSLLMACAQNLSAILESKPADVKMATLILDETSFSAEVVSNTRASAEEFQTRLKNRLGGIISFAPASGAPGGVRTLISGNISVVGQEAAVGTGSRMGAGELRAKLSELSGQAGTKLVELSVGDRISVGGVAKVPVFVKVIGAPAQCQEYLDRIAKTGLQFRVAKIIVIAGDSQLASMVLRLELLQPA